MKQIYFDHAAATPISKASQKAFISASKYIGNPSSYNTAGRVAAEVLRKARQRIARFLDARPEEVIFTASGSEANALAISGVLRQYPKGKVITTPIEHLSVLESAKSWTSSKNILYVRADKEGNIRAEDIADMLNESIVLVSVMYANNEIGTIEPVEKIGKIIREFRKRNATSFPLFHIDACQATEYLDMNVHHLGADLFSFNGSKVYGPRGVGVLYIRRGIELPSLITGGGQEGGFRAGTENVPGISALAAAIDDITRREGNRLTALRDYFFDHITKVVEGVRINGAMGKMRLPNNINISIPGLDSENMLLELDAIGISAGSGSACTARSVEPSHVLKAIGVKKPYLGGALRFSLGRGTTKKDIQYLLRVLPKIVARLRKRYDATSI